MSNDPTRILIVGASGMLGHAVARFFRRSPGYAVRGTVRSEAARALFAAEERRELVIGIDVLASLQPLAELLESWRPAVVVNCVGIVKQLQSASDPLVAIPINALFPHQLARLCEDAGARLVHISTDCVFSGRAGNYAEGDPADVCDLYGCSKLLGEVDRPHVVTLRTSLIGPELTGRHGLVEWFLARSGRVSGYSRAVFSGLPTVELARVIRDFVIPHPALHGVYHVASDPIDKCTLLHLVRDAYGKDIDIVPDPTVRIDRTLDASRFRAATGYRPPPWDALVAAMVRSGQAASPASAWPCLIRETTRPDAGGAART